MTPRGWRAPPGLAAKVAGIAQEHHDCPACGAAPGERCTDPGPGRTVHGHRWVTAAIALKRQNGAGWRTPERDAVLASLPRVPPEEIEACRLPGGGYSFTPAWFIAHGLPYPPIAGWRRAVERPQAGQAEGGPA